jgi:hypothetical protein
MNRRKRFGVPLKSEKNTSAHMKTIKYKSTANLRE